MHTQISSSCVAYLCVGSVGVAQRGLVLLVHSCLHRPQSGQPLTEVHLQIAGNTTLTTTSLWFKEIYLGLIVTQVTYPYL